MNKCLFCELTNWLSSLDWDYFFPIFLIFCFLVLLFFVAGLVIGDKDYEELYDRWQSEKELRESLEQDMKLLKEDMEL